MIISVKVFRDVFMISAHSSRDRNRLFSHDRMPPKTNKEIVPIFFFHRVKQYVVGNKKRKYFGK